MITSQIYISLLIAMCFLLTAFIFKPSMAYSDLGMGALLNEARTQHSQKTLEKSEQLTVTAQKYADDMADKNYFSHTGQDGSDHIMRIRKQGYKACYTAENIAKGQITASEVMNSWMKSKGHRVNNLSPKPTHYGVGHAKDVWVLVFARGC